MFIESAWRRRSMKREIIEVDQERGIRRVTFRDERYYERKILVGTPQECWDFVPSVTWISDHYPKGREFYRWLAEKGWSEAEEIKASQGDKGSKVHQAISVLLNGGTVTMKDCFENPRTLALEEITVEEYAALMSFCDWFQEFKPEVIANEYTVWNERYHYAGTVDLRCKMLGATWLIDFTISSQIWPSKRIQLGAYKHADTLLPRGAKLGVLQLNYKYNKKQKFKFTPIPDQFPLFLAVRNIWADACADLKPLQREYPLSLSLAEWS
jgi:hypothetical protein